MARGSSPWRPDAVVGTAGREHDRRPPDFQGPVGGLPNAPEAGAPCQPSGPLPGRADSGAVRTRPASGARGCQGGKRTLLGAPTGVSGLPRVAAPARPPPRSGDLDPVPFRPAARPPSLLAEGRGATAAEKVDPRSHPPLRGNDLEAFSTARDRAPSGWAPPLALGPTNPCPTAVHMEPFPTSALKAPV